MSMKKKFIAGAKCPQCGLMDKIYITEQAVGEGKLRACTRCDFVESLEDEQHLIRTLSKGISEQTDVIEIKPSSKH